MIHLRTRNAATAVTASAISTVTKNICAVRTRPSSTDVRIWSSRFEIAASSSSRRFLTMSNRAFAIPVATSDSASGWLPWRTASISLLASIRQSLAACSTPPIGRSLASFAATASSDAVSVVASAIPRLYGSRKSCCAVMT
jgi:hypothetical protein